MNKTFTEKVYEVVRHIPKRKVATYKDIATLVGSPGAARAVGTAVKNNPDVPRTPCHRVVGGDGKMHGYSAGNGIKTKEERLEAEGVTIKAGKVDLLKYRWNPNEP